MNLSGYDQIPRAGAEQEMPLVSTPVQEEEHEAVPEAIPEAVPAFSLETPPEGNLPAVAEAPAQPAKKGTRFQPGQSGNPSGRPKRTKEEKDALNEVRKLAPKAAQRLAKILEDETVSRAILLKAIEIVFDRTYGRPESSVKVTSVQETLEESEAYVMAVVKRARQKLKEETRE